MWTSTARRHEITHSTHTMTASANTHTANSCACAFASKLVHTAQKGAVAARPRLRLSLLLDLLDLLRGFRRNCGDVAVRIHFPVRINFEDTIAALATRTRTRWPTP